MFHKISISSLHSYLNNSTLESINSSGNKNACVDNTEYETTVDNSISLVVNQPIHILFDLEKTFLDSGFYENHETEYYNELGYIDDYFVTGDTVSRLDEVTAYSGQLIEGLNFASEGLFTGVLSKTAEYVHYVFNAKLDGDSIIEKTGVEYYTFIDNGFSFLKYHPNNIAMSIGQDFVYKTDNSYFEYRDSNIDDIAIDRGDFLTPSYLHEALAEINSLEDIEFSIFNI